LLPLASESVWAMRAQPRSKYDQHQPLLIGAGPAFLLKCHNQCFAISSILQLLGGQKLGNRNLGHPPSLPECHASDGLRMR